MSSPPPPPTIPIVDFTKWQHGTPLDRRLIASSLTTACRTVGFVHVANHSVPPALISKAFRFSQTFFSLPLETKMQAPHPPGSEVHRGYSWPGLEKVHEEDSAAEARRVEDVKESYEIGSEDFGDQPNHWLTEEKLPGFMGFMTGFYWACAEAASELLAALAMGLELDQEETKRFLGSHTGLNYQLRLLHYPEVERRRLEEGSAARMEAHSDWGSVTMLFQDGLGGLQVEDPGRKGVFVDAEPVEGALVLNVGDALMRWSNNHLKSTLHRVTLPPGQSSSDDNAVVPLRYSIPFFVSPDPDAVVECFPSCTSPDRPAAYPPIVFEDYRRMRASMQYSDS